PTAIAAFLGRPATGKPQAELWMGAHPSAPSTLPGGEPLDAAIARAPAELLGAELARRFDGKLPWLLKVLAAEQPLSLQAHPSLEQARAGFALEEQAGVPRTAAHRNYKDPNHKPELICALTPFDALCGFRPVKDTARFFRALQVPALDQLAAELEGANGLRAVFERLMTWPKAERSSLLEPVVRACAAHRGEFKAEAATVVELAQLYPGDVGAVTAMLLNRVRLKPLEALYLPAGNLHAYLRGVGVEIMASSDNVLRGGLTPKHVDVPELLRVLRFDAGPVEVLRPTPGEEGTYLTPAPEFRLSRLEVKGRLSPARRGPEMLLCAEGAVRAGDTALAKGEVAFVSASDGPYTLEGEGVVFRATANL
ncbi:MAG: mannose-6-phosphate isomerase, class I, partial [Myxococcaceae bacterium]|nr:mannose-6-phosphate isomerase, class I [Myxococcaceae bacterium]